MKDTTEAIKAVLMITKFVAEALQDGAQLHDIPDVVAKCMKAENAAVIKLGLEGISNVPGEFKAMGIADVMQLSMTMIGEVQEIIKTLAGQKP